MAKLINNSIGGFSVRTIGLENLPNKVIESKAELVSFCFLLLGIPEENCRKKIDCSKITEKFWKEFKSLSCYEETFSKFSEKELNNTYKYIVYLPACQKYETRLVIKTYFYLVESSIIDSNLPIAETGKSLLSWLSKIKETTKNNELVNNTELINQIIDYNIADLYINIKLDLGLDHSNNDFEFISDVKSSFPNNISYENSLFKIDNQAIVNCELSEKNINLYNSFRKKNKSKKFSLELEISKIESKSN